MTVGRPLVCTRVGAMAERADDGVEALFVPPGDAPALAEAIVRLLRDASLAERLGAAARVRVEREFGWDRIVRDVVGAYESARLQRATRRGAAQSVKR
jgi:glycosyltransferase involved in cell wall biosynthesis